MLPEVDNEYLLPFDPEIPLNGAEINIWQIATVRDSFVVWLTIELDVEF